MGNVVRKYCSCWSAVGDDVVQPHHEGMTAMDQNSPPPVTTERAAVFEPSLSLTEGQYPCPRTRARAGRALNNEKAGRLRHRCPIVLVRRPCFVPDPVTTFTGYEGSDLCDTTRLWRGPSYPSSAASWP